jgi:hypothetical protein
VVDHIPSPSLSFDHGHRRPVVLRAAPTKLEWQRRAAQCVAGPTWHALELRGAHAVICVAGASAGLCKRGLRRRRGAGRAASRSSRSGAGLGRCKRGLRRCRAKQVERQVGGGAGRVRARTRVSVGSSAVRRSRSGGGEEEQAGH